MTLSGVMAVIVRYSTEFGSFGADYVKVVEDWTIILSATKMLFKEYVLAMTCGDILRDFW